MGYKINKNLYDRTTTMQGILDGMKQVYDKVAITTGSLGRHIIIENDFGMPKIINDGVNITKDIWLEDKLENLGAQLIVSAADRTASKVGDNTSMTTILTYKFVEKGWAALKENEKLKAVHLVNGMHYQANEVLKELMGMRTQVSSPQDLFNVAHIASRDESVSNLIVQAIDKAGDNGVIHIIKSQKDEDYLEFAEGMKVNSGWLTPELISNKETMVEQLENPFVILINDNLTRPKPLGNIFNKILSDEVSSDKVLIIANDFSDEVLSFLIANNNRTDLKIQVFNTPGVNDNDKLENLLDIQTITQGEIFEIHGGNKLEEAELEDLGNLNKAIIKINESSLYKEKDENIVKAIENRVSYLKTILEDKELINTDLKRAMLKERIAKLTSGVALIRIYAPTQEALDDKWERTEDALRSAKSALSEGLLPGGAVGLKDATNSLRNSFEQGEYGKEFNLGREIVLNTLYSPFIQILRNAEYTDEEIEKFMDLPQGLGVNVFNGEVGNMMDKGVIDTFLGARMSILNALSSATMCLRVGGSITVKEKE